MAAKSEAQARIKINKLLESAGWRFFDDAHGRATVALEPHVKLTHAQVDALGNDFETSGKGFIDFLLLDDKGFPLVRTVFPGWDNEARRPGRGHTFAFSTPERYQAWLEFAVSYAKAHPVAGEAIVMINAWNEWAEGAKLEPDSRHGHAYLEATRRALADPDRRDGGPVR